MYIPPGFASVSPYFFVTDAEGFVAFLTAGLGGQVTLRTLRPDHKIANAQVQIGTATVLVSEASEAYPPMPGSFYVFVEDATQAMTRALDCGASLEMEVAEMPYGDRQGGVRDPWGNLWWLTQRLIPEPYAE